MKTLRIRKSRLAPTLLAAGLLALAGGVANAAQSPADCTDNDFVLHIGKTGSIFHVGDTVIWNAEAGNVGTDEYACDLIDVTITKKKPHEADFSVLQPTRDYPVGAPLLPTIPSDIPYVIQPGDAGNEIKAHIHADGILQDGHESTQDLTKNLGIRVRDPRIEVLKTCFDALGPNKPIDFVGTIENTGDQDLYALECTDDPSAIGDIAIVYPTGEPLKPAEVATYSGSYQPEGVGDKKDIVTCRGREAEIDPPFWVEDSGDDTCNVPDPSYHVTKSCISAPVPDGGLAEWQVDIVNTGDTEIVVTLNDVEVPDFDGKYNVSPLSTKTLTKGKAINYPGLTNTVKVTAAETIGGYKLPLDNDADNSARCLVIPEPAIKVTKTCVDAATPSDPITFSGSITNTGDGNMELTDCADAPAADGGLVYEDGSGPVTLPHTLAEDEFINYSGKYFVGDVGIDFKDTVTCKATSALDAKTYEGSASDSCDVLSNPSIDVTKTCVDAEEPGLPITFSGKVNNTGDERVMVTECADEPYADLAYEDSLGNPVTLPHPLDVGDFIAYSGEYMTSAAGIDFKDTVTCKATALLSDTPLSDNASDICDVAPADYSIVKTCSPDSMTTGDTIKWEICATNDSEFAEIDVTLEDTQAFTGVKTLLKILPGEERCVAEELSRETLPADEPAITNVVTANAETAGGYKLPERTDNATCKVESPKEGCWTRTGGYWGTHPEVIVAEELLPVMSCGAKVTNVGVTTPVSSTEDICFSGRDFKAGNNNTATSPQQAQLIRQCTVAALNVSVTAAYDGSCDSVEMLPNDYGKTFADVYAACCGVESICTDELNGPAISNSGCIELIDDFNNTVDTGEGQPWTSQPANPTACKAANGNSWMNPERDLGPK